MKWNEKTITMKCHNSRIDQQNFVFIEFDMLSSSVRFCAHSPLVIAVNGIVAVGVCNFDWQPIKIQSQITMPVRQNICVICIYTMDASISIPLYMHTLISRRKKPQLFKFPLNWILYNTHTDILHFHVRITLSCWFYVLNFTFMPRWLEVEMLLWAGQFSLGVNSSIKINQFNLHLWPFIDLFIFKDGWAVGNTCIFW